MPIVRRRVERSRAHRADTKPPPTKKLTASRTLTGLAPSIVVLVEPGPKPKPVKLNRMPLSFPGTHWTPMERGRSRHGSALLSQPLAVTPTVFVPGSLTFVEQTTPVAIT
eukprot:gene3991-4345_t